MKNKSLFTQTILVILLAVICLFSTVGIAFLAGSLNAEIFDFKNLNFSNMIPVLLIGGFISCFIVGICILFVGRSAFIKVKDYFNENNKENGGTKKWNVPITRGVRRTACVPTAANPSARVLLFTASSSVFSSYLTYSIPLLDTLLIDTVAFNYIYQNWS